LLWALVPDRPNPLFNHQVERIFLSENGPTADNTAESKCCLEILCGNYGHGFLETPVELHRIVIIAAASVFLPPPMLGRGHDWNYMGVLIMHRTASTAAWRRSTHTAGGLLQVNLLCTDSKARRKRTRPSYSK